MRSLERLSSQVARAIEGVKLIEQRAAGRSEARFRSLVQNSSDLIAVLDENGAFTYLAPSVQSVLGFEAETSGKQAQVATWVRRKSLDEKNLRGVTRGTGRVRGALQHYS